MPGIDPHTLVIVVSVLAVLLSMIMLAMRAGLPRAVEGIGYWATGTLLFVGSSILFSQQNTPPSVHIMLANCLLLLGVSCMMSAMLRFYGRPPPRRAVVAAGTAVLLSVLAWYTFAQPSFLIRLTIMSLALSAIFARLCWLPLRHGRRSVGTAVTSAAFALTMASCLLRMISVVAGWDRPSALLDLGTVQSIYLASFNVGLLLGSVGFILMANERLHNILEFNASHDALTGALNRGAFFELAEAHIATSRAGGGLPCSVALLDLDHFKQINDQYGHAIGDRVLKHFCQATRSVLRPIDALGRYGGEEFVVLLPGMGRSEAGAVAQRLRNAIQHAAGVPPYTVSIGLATLSDAVENIDELLIAADQALYEAKRNGRNRIEEWNSQREVQLREVRLGARKGAKAARRTATADVAPEAVTTERGG